MNATSGRSLQRALKFAALALLTGSQLSRTQTASNQSEVTSHDSSATFTARVNLVMVPVVVRDKQGHAIGTLQQSDFQLFDKGKLQTISKFSVEKLAGNRGATPAIELHASPADPEAPKPSETAKLEAPNHFIAYLFDDLHLAFGDIAQARIAAARHLRDTLQPTDRAAIYTTSGQDMLDFTDDQAKMQETLERIQPRGRSLPSSVECPDVSYYMGDLIQNKNDPTALQTAERDAIICADIVVPNTPGGMQAAMQQAEPLARGAASRVLAYGETDTKTTLSVLMDVVRRMSASPGQRTIVLVSPGFFITNDYRPEEIDLMDRAIRANVVISALDARGLYVIGPGSDVSEPQRNSQTAIQKDSYVRDSDTLSWGTLAELADGTGGTFVHNNNDLVEGLARVAAAPEYIYILGFSPQNLKLDGSFHALKVNLKMARDLVWQARRGYYAPRHEIDPAEQAKQEIREAIFSRDEMLDIPLDIQTQFFKSGDVTAKLAVLAKVDVKNLHYRKVDGRNNDTLVIVSSVFDRNGNLVSALEKRLDMRWRDETLETKLGSGITLKTNFDVTPGSYVIRVVARDQEGQMMAARNGVVEIP